MSWLKIGEKQKHSGLKASQKRRICPQKQAILGDLRSQLKQYQRHRLLGRMCCSPSTMSNSAAIVECNDVLAGGI